MSTLHAQHSRVFWYFVPLTNCRYSVRENLTIESVEQTIEELKLFRAAGGNTIVDVTSIGIRRVSIAAVHHTLIDQQIYIIPLVSLLMGNT